MPSDQQVQSSMVHPVLGPGVALYDNCGRTRLRLVLWIVLIPLGLFGIWLGRGDVVSGNVLLGLAQALAGVVVVVYGVQAAIADVRRLGQSVRLVVARDGFALVPGKGVVSWGEVEAIRDPKAPDGQPRSLRIRLMDPAAFRQTHTLSLTETLWLRFNRGVLDLGDGTAMPVSNVQTLMRRRLTEFQGQRPSEAVGAPIRRPRKRR